MFLAGGKCRGDGCGPQVVHRVPIAVVQFGGMRGRPIDEGCRARRRLAPRHQIGRIAGGLVQQQRTQYFNRGIGRAGIGRRIPIDQGALGVPADLCGQGFLLDLVGKCAQDFYGMHAAAST
ncbi:hypothetical protein D3C73_1296920 [compost metagenome]